MQGEFLSFYALESSTSSEDPADKRGKKGHEGQRIRIMNSSRSRKSSHGQSLRASLWRTRSHIKAEGT